MPAPLDESRELLQLGDADGGLHIGRLQIVADVRVDVLVIVPVRQITKVPVESLATGVFLSGITPAIASPVTERFDDGLHLRRVREHTPALAHRDMVRWVEAHGGEIAEAADVLPAIGRSECVAAVLCEPEIVTFGERGDRVDVEWVA